MGYGTAQGAPLGIAARAPGWQGPMVSMLLPKHRPRQVQFGCQDGMGKGPVLSPSCTQLSFWREPAVPCFRCQRAPHSWSPGPCPLTTQSLTLHSLCLRPGSAPQLAADGGVRSAAGTGARRPHSARLPGLWVPALLSPMLVRSTPRCSPGAALAWFLGPPPARSWPRPQEVQVSARERGAFEVG